MNAIAWHFDGKKNQVQLRNLTLNIEACQDQQHFPALPVRQDTTARIKIRDFLMNIPQK